MKIYYFMKQAMKFRRKANCFGNRVGAVIVKEDKIISSGFNGTLIGLSECENGGCERCADKNKYPLGTGYEICMCMHAEQMAILNAAKNGIQIEGGTLFTTMRPCIGCTKELIQTGIRHVYYLHDWIYSDLSIQDTYLKLQRSHFSVMNKVEIEDKDAVWALHRLRENMTNGSGCDELGHSLR